MFHVSRADEGQYISIFSADYHSSIREERTNCHHESLCAGTIKSNFAHESPRKSVVNATKMLAHATDESSQD